MNYAEMEAELFARARGGMKLGLDRMERALDALGRPERCAPCIHVAGTNGKGSVCAMLDAAGRAAGLRTGLYTSPHLEQFAERFRIGGVSIPEPALLALYLELRERVPWAFDGPDALTFFELVTLLAFQHFARFAVELMIVEVGLGGRLDATNVVCPAVACITSIGFDHQEFLGSTLSAIAGEKAGILKPATPAVVSIQSGEALAAIEERAAEVSAPLSLEGRDFRLSESGGGLRFVSPEGTLDGIRLGLRGRHQRSNAAVALRAVELARGQGISIDSIAARSGVADVRWPGRLESVAWSPEIVLDGAHNPAGAESLAAACRELFAGRRIVLVLGVLADKDLQSMLRALVPMAARIIATAPANPRALPAAQLASAIHAPVAVEVAATSRDALARVREIAGPDDVIVVAGSLYLVGEVRSALRGESPRGPAEILR